MTGLTGHEPKGSPVDLSKLLYENRVRPGTLIYDATTRLDRLAASRPPGEARTPEWWDWRTSLRDAEECWHETARIDPPWALSWRTD